jgi:serine/threonine-protein kinase RsbW
MTYKNQKIEIHSDFKEIHIVESFIDGICDLFHIGFDYYGFIKTAVIEAVENAIVHGNSRDTSLRVYISCTQTKDGLLFSIKDEGRGYKVSDFFDASRNYSFKENTAGRGLFIIKTLSDNLDFNDKGSEIRLTFIVRGMNKEVSTQREEYLTDYQDNKSKSTKDILTD